MREMLALQQELLGDPNQRTWEKPYIDPGSGRLVGGTAFERTGIQGAGDGGRTYNIGLTVQSKKGLWAPGNIRTCRSYYI